MTRVLQDLPHHGKMAGMHDDRLSSSLLPPLTDHAARRSLVRAAARLLGAAEAEDAVQDALVRALESGADTSELNAAQAWLHTVVRNLAIDRLRRRQWMQQWLAEVANRDDGGMQRVSSPSAESEVALAQQARHALRVLAARLAPADGAAVLLYEVFEASHAELAQAGGKTEAGSRQQLRRALLRLRLREAQADGDVTAEPLVHPDLRENEEATFRVYLQSLQLRDPQALWAMLGQPPVRAVVRTLSASGVAVLAGAHPATAAATTTCGVVQVGGQLGLVLTLDGVRLCVLPLGVRSVGERDLESVAV
ncbi:sigma-70 family RNA polymerase sigma factor [Acidovorax sp.]|uniref:sigma-70 family RNA polymerase sigma factor n=1 Tax=Acidovorax sp. TaxID=1872122 RepID=UPI002ACDDCD9|nr:sigma-70 family RNA polymerase sigma factor [Acidovorax sp.]